MQLARFAILASSAVVGWLSFAPAPAAACKCAEQSVEVALSEASAVFEGRVIAVSPRQGASTTLDIKLKVVRTWKGLRSEEQVTVQTPSESAACGVPFAVNESYLVYARQEENTLHAAACSRTRPFAAAGEDLAALGAGVVPVQVAPLVPEAGAEKPKDNTSAGCASFGAAKKSVAAGAMLPFFATALTWRRRRR